LLGDDLPQPSQDIGFLEREKRKLFLTETAFGCVHGADNVKNQCSKRDPGTAEDDILGAVHKIWQADVQRGTVHGAGTSCIVRLEWTTLAERVLTYIVAGHGWQEAAESSCM
jgi:hypothetical protein